jgi:hypothetical protein
MAMVMAMVMATERLHHFHPHQLDVPRTNHNVRHQRTID